MHRRSLFQRALGGAALGLLPSDTVSALLIPKRAPAVLDDSKNELQSEGIDLVNTRLRDGAHPYLAAVRFSLDPYTDQRRIVLFPTFRVSSTPFLRQLSTTTV